MFSGGFNAITPIQPTALDTQSYDEESIPTGAYPIMPTIPNGGGVGKKLKKKTK
jgi:hypothetical protein